MVKRTNLKKPFEAVITDMLKESRQNNTRPTGDKVFEPGDTAIFEGVNGDSVVITGGDIVYIGDTVPPAPGGITASGSMSVVTVTWNGSLADPTEALPSDWSHIEVWADGKRMGEIYGSARNSMSFESTAGTTHSIITYAVDKAGNRSEASEPVSVTVESAVGGLTPELQQQLDDNTQAISDAQTELDNVALAASGASTKADQALNTANALRGGNLVPSPNIAKDAVWGSSFNIQSGTGFNGKGAYNFTDSTTGQTFAAQYPAGAISVEQGKKYYVSAHIKSTTALGQSPLSRSFVRAYKADNTYTQVSIASAPQATANTWTRVAGDYVPAAGVVAITIGYEVFGSNVGEILWSNPIVSQYTDVGLIEDDGIPASKLLVDDRLDAKLGNFLHINVENLTATGTANLNNVVAQRIAAGTADFQKVRIENLTAGTGTMDSVVAGKIAGSLIQSGLQTDSGAFSGVKFQASGITAWNGTAVPTFNLNATTGDVTINGGTFTSSIIQTSSEANRGLKITPDGLTLFDNAGKALVKMSASGSAEIDGSAIATDSITADKISLVGGDKNVLTSGDGSTAQGWVDADIGSAITSSEYRTIGSTTGFPAGAKGYFILHTLYNKLGSAKFGITEGNGLKIGLNWRRTTSTADPLQVQVEFLNRTGSSIEKRFIVSLSGGSTNVWQRYDHPTEILAPAGTYQARIIYTRGSGAFQITNTTVLTSVETKLTPTGLTSSINGVETVRLNGEDNMVVGRFRTAPLGLPQVMLSPTSASYNGTQLAVWFTPDGNTPGGITAGLWMENVPTASTAYPLSIRGQGNAGVDIWGALTIKPNGSSTSSLITTGGQDLLIRPSGANTVVAGNKVSLKASGDADLTSAGVAYIEGSYVRLHSNSSSDPMRITNGTSGSTWDYSFTTSSGANMALGTNGTIRKTGSSKRFKVDITPFEPDERYLDIETYTFRDKGAVERAAHIDRSGDLTDEERLLVHEADTWHLGTIAEYAQDKSPLQVTYDLDGNVINYAYDRDGAMLRPFVRKLVHDYKELRAEVDQLKKLLHT